MPTLSAPVGAQALWPCLHPLRAALCRGALWQDSWVMTVCRRTTRWPLSTIKPNKKTLPRPTPCRKPTNILHSLAYWPGRVKLQKKNKGRNCLETATIAVLFMGMRLVRSGAHLETNIVFLHWSFDMLAFLFSVIIIVSGLYAFWTHVKAVSLRRCIKLIERRASTVVFDEVCGYVWTARRRADVGCFKLTGAARAQKTKRRHMDSWKPHLPQSVFLSLVPAR